MPTPVPRRQEINSLPIKTVGNASVLVGDIGKAEDSGALQTNIVRIDGQRSVYMPILKQGGNSNTITIVNGIKGRGQETRRYSRHAQDRRRLRSVRICKAGHQELVNEAAIGLVLTGVMILVFLGSPRATVAVLLSVPLSAAGVPSHRQRNGWLHQHHDPRRPGSRFLASDR